MHYKIIRNHFECRFSFLLQKYYLQFLSDEQLFVLLVVLVMLPVLVLASSFSILLRLLQLLYVLIFLVRLKV